MFELLRYYARRRVRSAIALTAGLSALTAMYVALYPTIAASVDLDEYARAFPEAVREAFGIVTMATMEGFLAVELYNAMWVLLLGLYFAYSAASLIAGDVEHDRIEILLSLPVSRSRVVLEKFLSLSVPLAILNAGVAVVVVVATRLVGHPVPITDAIAVHLLSIPYLLTCAGIGLGASVVVDRTSVAHRLSLGTLFGLFLVESLVSGTDYAWIGAIAPMRYFDPSAIMVKNQYDVGGALLLLGGSLVLVIASQQWFRRRDV